MPKAFFDMPSACATSVTTKNSLLGTTKDAIIKTADLLPIKKVVFSLYPKLIFSSIPAEASKNNSFIQAAVESKLLDAFILLEKQLGNLDDLDFSIDIPQQEELGRQIQNIIFNDNSIKIGDNNCIENSVIKTGSKGASF